MNALAYYRVSTDEQAQEGKSLETQKRLCQKWARENGYEIIGEYQDEGKSATSLNRPALKEMLARAQEDKTIKVVLVQDTDRLARNTLDHLTIKSLLEKREISLISISQPMIDNSPEGSLIDTIIASVNAFQSQITGRKTSKVLEEKARLGWWPGGFPPLGYKNVENRHPSSTLDRKIIDIDKETAPYIKKAFQLYGSGQYSAQRLADKLYKEGLRSKSGGIIHDSVLIYYLKNPFYIGQMRWNKQLFRGKHPLFITEELFYRCQKILTLHNQNATRVRKHDYILRGFIYCASCSKRMWAEKHTKKSGLVFEHYFCVNCRKNSYVNTSELEQQVESKFDKIQITKEYSTYVIETAKQLLKEFRESKHEDRVTLFNRKSRLESAMREAEDNRFIRHSIEDEAFKRIYGRYEEELKAINSQINQLENDHSDTISKIEKLFELAENIGKTYREADNNLKRLYLDLFWEGFDVKEGRIVKSRLKKGVISLISEDLVRVGLTGLRD